MADAKAHDKRTTGLICLALALAVFAVFWGAFSCDFVNYDDPIYVTSNLDIRNGLTWDSLRWSLIADAGSNWHPITWFSHILDVQIYGTKAAWGHHLTNLLLHAANSILLFLILKRMTGAMWRSAMVAALFALHPLRVESVVWISERKDVLSTLFWMLSVGAYVKAKLQNSKSKFQYVLSLVFFACGLMSKPMVVTLPCVLLLLDYWPLKRWKGWKSASRLVMEKIPFFALALGLSVITVIAQRHGGAVTSLTGLSLDLRIENAFISYVRYLQKTFWPMNLSVLYPHPFHWPMWEVIGCAILLAAITALVIWRMRAQPYLAVGWFWFLGTLIPAIGLVQVGIQSMADRYSYVPIIGVFIMVVWAARDARGKLPSGRWILGSLGWLAIAACAVLTPLQTRYWTNSETLFLHAVDVTDKNYLAYNNIGFFLSNRGKEADAMKYFESSLQINPNYEDALNNLGYALACAGRYQEAIPKYQAALRINPHLAETHNNLGNALGNVGRQDEAIQEYLLALRDDPRHAEAHNNYGIALAFKGQFDEATEQFRLAIRYRENYASAHSNLGNAFAVRGQLDDAIKEYQISLQLSPDDSQAHNNIANALSQKGRLDEAVEHYRTALKLKPENPETHFNLGFCLARKGDRAGAEAEYLEALRQRPNYPEAQTQLRALRNEK